MNKILLPHHFNNCAMLKGMRVYSLRFEECPSEWCWDGLRVSGYIVTMILASEECWWCEDVTRQTHQETCDLRYVTKHHQTLLLLSTFCLLVENIQTSSLWLIIFVCWTQFCWSSMMCSASLHHCMWADSGSLSNESILIRAGVRVIRHQDNYHKNWSSGTSWNIREGWESSGQKPYLVIHFFCRPTKTFSRLLKHISVLGVGAENWINGEKWISWRCLGAWSIEFVLNDGPQRTLSNWNPGYCRSQAYKIIHSSIFLPHRAKTLVRIEKMQSRSDITFTLMD